MKVQEKTADLDEAGIKPLGSDNDEGLAEYASSVKVEEPSKFSLPKMGPRKGIERPTEEMSYVTAQMLEKAKLFQDRAAVYGDNYHRFGPIMKLLLNGQKINTEDSQEVARLGILVQIVSKVTRYAENFSKGGHDDSLDDMAVYSMMLKELDHRFKY